MNYEIAAGKVLTRALEYHIVDHCNLHCDHCCSFSPLLKKWTVDPIQFESDLRSVSRAVSPRFLKIVGGEPLLHPELEQLLLIAKGLQVAPFLSLTTNGMFIEKLSGKSWDAIDLLTVSLYPSPALEKPLIRFIAAQAAQRGIRVSWKVQDKFTCLDRSERATTEEATAVFRSCWIRHRCNSIKGGRFYCCTRPQYIQKLAPDPERYQADGIPLDQDLSILPGIIKAHLEGSEPLESCFLCQGGDAPLATQRQLDNREIRAKRESLRVIAG